MAADFGQIAFWNSEAGRRWATFQAQIDRAFAPLSAAGLAYAKPRPAEAVLDVGCGCGATLLELAKAVGTNGNVLGVDVSQPMLAIAEQRARARGLAAVRCVLADAATHPLGEDAFDLVFSRFGVMFFDNPVGAFANLRRALRPDGRLVFVCWRDLAANPWFHVPARAVRPFLPPSAPADPHAPGPLAFADPARVGHILESAGFGDVRFEAFDAKLRLGIHSRASELVSQIGPVARLLESGTDRARACAKSALNDALRTNETNGDVILGGGVWIVSARRAARETSSSPSAS